MRGNQQGEDHELATGFGLKLAKLERMRGCFLRFGSRKAESRLAAPDTWAKAGAAWGSWQPAVHSLGLDDGHQSLTRSLTDVALPFPFVSCVE